MRPYFLNLTIKSFFNVFVSIYLLFKDLLLIERRRSFKTEHDLIYELDNYAIIAFLLRKEVIHPHVPVGIPCYDLTPITCPTLDGSLLAVRPPVSGITSSHGLTGGVYKARERIHRDILIRDY